jgi:hypothetical protein
MGKGHPSDRVAVVVRLPARVLREYERRAKDISKRLGISYSRNDAIVAALTTAVRGDTK